MRLPYRSVLYSPSIVRIGVRPDDPKAVVGPRPRGSRRPHTDATVAQVRRLVEQSVLTYAQIAAKTGVPPASICRWAQNGGWKRPLFAPRATDTIPTARASARLKMRTLAARLFALADRYVRELEETPGVDLQTLGEALELLKMARFAARPKRRFKPPLVPAHKREAPLVSNEETQEPQSHKPAKLDSRARGNERREMYEDPARVLARLQNAGVDLNRAPHAALKDVIEAHAPPRDFPELRMRGVKSKRNREHAWMLERDKR